MSDDFNPNSGLDYGEDAPKGLSPEEAFPRINALYRAAVSAEKDVELAAEALKAANARYRALMEKELPELMEQCKVVDFTTEDGVNVSVKEKIENSIPAPRRNEAWDWLIEHGHGDIIKREVSVSFGVSEGDKADELAKRLGKELARSVGVERKAEPATVKSLLTARLKAGKEVPMELFGVRRFKVAEFKTKKKK